MSITADVERSLRNLKDARTLRRLVASTLGYDDRGAGVDTSGWKPDLLEDIDEQPILLASGGQGGSFVVVHTRLAHESGISSPPGKERSGYSTRSTSAGTIP